MGARRSCAVSPQATLGAALEAEALGPAFRVPLTPPCALGASVCWGCQPGLQEQDPFPAPGPGCELVALQVTQGGAGAGPSHHCGQQPKAAGSFHCLRNHGAVVPIFLNIPASFHGRAPLRCGVRGPRAHRDPTLPST